jgi:hypothetical protein
LNEHFGTNGNSRTVSWYFCITLLIFSIIVKRIKTVATPDKAHNTKGAFTRVTLIDQYD